MSFILFFFLLEDPETSSPLNFVFKSSPIGVEYVSCKQGVGGFFVRNDNWSVEGVKNTKNILIYRRAVVEPAQVRRGRRCHQLHRREVPHQAGRDAEMGQGAFFTSSSLLP